MEMRRVFEKIFGANDVTSADAEDRGATVAKPCVENQRRRRQAEIELSLARAGKGGFFKLKTSLGEKLVFNVWLSPHDGHFDRRGKPVRRVFPKTYDKNGVRVAKIPFNREDGQGPYFPIGILYGSPIDPKRFPAKHREILETFLGPMVRAVKEYNTAYGERKRQK